MHQLEVWTRPIFPLNKEKENSFAVLFINQSKKSTKMVKLVWKELGLISNKGYLVRNVYTNEDYGTVYLNDHFTHHILEHDVVFLHCKVND